MDEFYPVYSSTPQWIEIISIISALITGMGGGWFFARRKYKAEVKSIEIENWTKIQDWWNDVFKVITDQNRDMIAYSSQLISQNLKLQEDNAAKKLQITNFKLQSNEQNKETTGN